MKRAGRVLKETDFNTPTSAYSHFESLHPILDYWSGLGRTMIVKTNKGGWFPPHRDSPLLTRDTFRVICFLGNSDTNSYEWWLGDSRRIIIPNTTYKFRVEFVGHGYTFANALSGYWSSQSHNTQVHIWKKRCDNNTWYQHTDSTTTISSWPGHLYLPFSTIAWHETNTTSSGCLLYTSPSPRDS